jgi:hypothetical protein
VWWKSIGGRRDIDTGNGIKIFPNGALATDSFTNLSRVQGASYRATATLCFTAADRPGTVKAALLADAGSLGLDDEALDTMAASVI